MINYLIISPQLISFKDLNLIMLSKNQNYFLRTQAHVYFLKIIIEFRLKIILVLINHFLKIHSPPHIFKKYSNNNFPILLFFLPFIFLLKIKYFENHFYCNFQAEFNISSIFFLSVYIGFSYLLLGLLLCQKILSYGHIKYGRGHRCFCRTYHLFIIKSWSYRTKR